MPIQLLFAIHNHQPDGNFGHVFEQAYNDCYGPLLDALADAPHVKATLHHTGPLLEWIERERKDYFAKLRALVERGQIELLGGGFYEPMLAVLPERDARGQIHMMSDYLERHFGVRPEGMWLAERVWEPALAKLIADCGITFTLVDDGHFRSAGMEGTLRGYYVTEKAGTPLAIFPIDKNLREAIPFLKAWESLDVIARLGRETPPGMPAGVTYGDDGEKFGVWPHTKEWVWGAGWLKDFLRMLGERRHEVETAHFGAFMRANPPTGRVYLPTASYEEMGEWALPADAQGIYNDVRRRLKERGELDRARPFVRGGIWQNFLAKYPEANQMHKKMVQVSSLLERAEAKAPAGRLDDARRELYRAQCNCSYWHGLFGGLYLNYLRDTVYHRLIDAELAAEGALGEHGPRAVVRDLDSDLRDEVLLVNDDVAAYVDPADGGGVWELDFRPKRFNLLNVLARRPEGYHQKLVEALRARAGGHHQGGGPVSIHELVEVKAEGLDELLNYDRHPRHAFIEHFLAPGTTLEALATGRYDERGDFAGQTYGIMGTSVEGGRPTVALERRGHVDGRPVTIDKTIVLDGTRLTARYRVTADGPAFAVTFAPELSLTLLAGDAPDRYYRVVGQPALPPSERRLASRGETAPGHALELVNEWDRFLARVSTEPAAPLWRYPLETASQSEGGFERTYQGSVLVPIFRDVRLGSGLAFEAQVSVDLVLL
jgi:alpha-amylase